MGTEAASMGDGHGGADAVAPGFVTGGADHAAVAEGAGDDNGLAAQIRAAEEFHRNEERIEVDMENGGAPFAHMFAF
jgi:hypothetical protein